MKQQVHGNVTGVRDTLIEALVNYTIMRWMRTRSSRTS